LGLYLPLGLVKLTIFSYITLFTVSILFLVGTWLGFKPIFFLFFFLPNFPFLGGKVYGYFGVLAFVAFGTGAQRVF